MKELKKLPQIIKHCMTIGEIPTSYKVSLTYEEQLMWFCRFLEEEVIPVVNNNSEAIQELQNFIVNYFDNLDVQDEINNKLEAMAESGELQEIIENYINLKSMLVFDTVADMKEATNLVDGSYVKTYGNLEFNDTEGAFYKIREVTNQDVVDNFHIIALETSETLIAERINSNIINLNIDDYEGFVNNGDWLPAFEKAFSDIYNSSPNHDLLGIVNLGHKVYTIKNTLTLPNRMIIDGHDVGILEFTDDTKDYINFVTKDGIFVGNAGGIKNVTISGTATEPIATNNTTVNALTIGSEAQYGTTRGSLSYAVFDNIRIQNAPGNGLKIVNYVGAMQVTNICVSNVGGIGLLLHHVTDSIFNNFRITGTRLAGMQLDSYTAQNKFDSFKIYACGLAGTDISECASIKMSYNSRNMFSNFECQDNGGAGLYMNHCDYNQFSNFLVDRSGVHIQAGNYYIYNSNNNEGNIESCNYTNTIDSYLGIYLSNSYYNKFNYISDDRQTSADVDTGITNELYGNNKRHKYIDKNLSQLSGTVNLQDVPFDYLELTFTEGTGTNSYNYARKVVLYKGQSLDVDNCFANTTRMIKYIRPISLNAAGTELTLSDMIKYTISASGTTIEQQASTEKSLYLKEIAYCKD